MTLETVSVEGSSSAWAKEQVVDLAYAAVLKERGVAVVRQVAVVFDGKEVWAAEV